MRIEVIFCPSCNHKLRVPENLMGQPVRCPQCGANFAAPPPPDHGPGDSPEFHVSERPVPHVGRPNDNAADFDDRPRREHERHREDDYWDDRDVGRPPPKVGAGKIVAPGFVLIGIAVLQFLVIAARMAIAFLNPALIRQNQQQLQAMFPAAAGGPDPVLLSIIMGIAFLILNFFVLFGGIAMVRRRMYPMAMIGAFLTLLDFNECCCLLSIPVGIWALIILFQADVKASFS